MNSEPNGEIIKITNRDVKQDVLNCIDFEKNIWIKQGLPTNTDTGIVDREVMRNLSGPPYVFRADTMKLYDNKHLTGVELNNVGVIFMHGGREGVDGKWMFSSLENGYPVVETVRAVNEYLMQKGEPLIEVVMACNNYPPSDIKVGDFNSNENIVYAVGETVSLMNAGMFEDGKINFTAKASDFWGLDNLTVSQQIKISQP
jgi:hypothetical protein